MSQEKTCKMCKEEWPADSEFFFRDKNYKDGFSLYCKACYHDMPSRIRKTAMRNGGAPIRSDWEKLFPELWERSA